MMHYNGLISFGALFVNAVLGPLALLLVASAGPGIFLSFAGGWCAELIANIQKYALHALILLSEAGASGNFPCSGMAVSSGICVFYYCMLALFMSGIRPVCIRFCAFAAMVAMILYFPFRGQEGAFVVWCASEKGGASCIAYSDGPHRARILRPGAGDAAAKVLRELRQRGRGDFIDIMVTGTSDLPGARVFIRRSRAAGMDCGRLAMTGKRTARTEELLEYAAYNGWNIHYSAPEVPVRIDDISPGCRLVEFNGRTAVLENCLRPGCNFMF